MSSIRLRNIVKRYGAAEAVRGIDLEVTPGEFVVLLGPSGCGKTTTLRMVAGLEDITEGDLFIGERHANLSAPKERGVAMVFQNYALYPHMSVRQNMEFALKPLRLDAAEVARRIEDTADILGLAELLERRPSQLSGGQRQRVAMGRAMVRTPQVFLFDEPLSNLDAKLRTQMRLEIRKLHNRLGATTLYVTHDQTEAMTLADRIVIMRDGHIEQVGSPEEIYAHPANVFVAGFIGSPPMNMIPVRMEGATWEADGFSLAPSPHVAGEFAEGRDLIVGVRPADVSVGAADAAGAVRARVEVVEYLGTTALLDARIGAHEMRIETPAAQRPQAGSDIGILFAESNPLHLFDAETGASLASDIATSKQEKE